MRVLFITSTFSVHRGDAQVPWLLAYVKRLQARGVDVDVFAPASRGTSSHSIEGVSVYRFRYAPASWEILTHDEGALFKLRTNKLLFFLPLFYFICGSIAILIHCARHRYDVIHVHWPFPQAIFGMLAQGLTGGKLVYSVYGAEFALVARLPFGRWLFRFFLGRADAVIGISDFTKKRIVAVSPVAVSVIPFTTSMTRSPSARAKYAHSQGTRILFVGRLIERKGVSYLIEAMRLIMKKIPSAQLDIVGGGPLLSPLQQQVRTLGLTSRVALHGRVNMEDLVKLYDLCDVFVLPAIVDKWGDTEGLGVVILEAMSFAKPVVASRIGGITDIVTDGVNGLLVPQKDVRALSQAIVDVLTSSRLRRKLTTEAHHTYRDVFSWDSIIKRTIKLYRV